MTKPHPEEVTNETDPVIETDGKGNDEQDARIADLEKQLAEVKDRLLREMAEAENTRRRSQKEREDVAKYAVGNFAKDMLSVADNFRRALDSAPVDHLDAGVKNRIAGIEATERQMQATLERFGIKKIEPIGQAFDPNFHQVMMEVEAPDQTPGTVVQVLQPGYMIHDRLLREALVSVAKGSPHAVPHSVDTSA